MHNIDQLIKEFYPFAKNRMGFEKPVRVVFRNDHENAKNPLGKTAFYSPEDLSITLYTTNRHPKDVLRSFSHELVHHAQNCRGEFDGGFVGEQGYAQKDKHMREMEREAYEQGNMCFRDWEDQKKQTQNIGETRRIRTMTEVQLREAVKAALQTFIKKEGKKPDFLDIDKDGDKEESMKDAADSVDESAEEVTEETTIQEIQPEPEMTPSRDDDEEDELNEEETEESIKEWYGRSVFEKLRDKWAK